MENNETSVVKSVNELAARMDGLDEKIQRNKESLHEILEKFVFVHGLVFKKKL